MPLFRSLGLGKLIGRPKRKYCMPIESRNLFALEITAHCRRHYGFLLMSRNLSFYSQRGNISFPTWEYLVPSVGIICQIGACLLSILIINWFGVYE